MRHDSSLRAISNVLAVLVIAGGALYGLEALGFRTGLPETLICRVGQGIVSGPVRELVPWGLVLSVMLLIPPFTRGAGITLLALSIGGLVLIDLWQQQAGAFCSGWNSGGSTQ